MMPLFARAGAWLGFGATLSALAFLACSSDDSKGPTSTVPGNAGEPQFRALQSDLVASCGGANGSCHVRGTYRSAPTWLGDPDPYASAKKYRGVLPATRDVADSILLTQVAHEGPALKDVQGSLFERVSTWLQAEVPTPLLPNTGAFPVADGVNQVSLQSIAGLANAKLSFLANGQNGILILTGIKIEAPPDANIKVSAPFFVILPRSGKVSADPDVNGFKGELTIPAGESRDLFAGKINLLRWDRQGQLKLVFESVEVTPGKGSNGACNALPLFQSKALTAFQSQVTVIDPDEGDGGSGGGDGGTVIGTGSCIGCHAEAGDNPKYPAAINAMDLRAYATDPDAACRNARRWISFTDRPNSPMLGNPTGRANPAHPMKALADGDPIVTGIAEWVNAEQP